MFREQVVLITGCSSGIGLATTLAAAARGHRVWATARDPEGLAGLTGREGVTTFPLDVTDPEGPRRAVEALLATEGRLDALVNNAGYGRYGSVEDVPLDDWRRQFDVNVFGTLRVTQAALPAMRAAGRGTVVNLSSVGGKVSIPFAAPYCSSKHAVEAISDALRVEVAPFGIRVVVIESGPIVSRFDARARAEVEPLLSSPGPYAPFYPGARRAMDTDFQMGKLPAEAVARVILAAIESPRPRTRYAVTSMARLFLPLKRIMPDRFFDWRMRKALRLPDRV